MADDLSWVAPGALLGQPSPLTTCLSSVFFESFERQLEYGKDIGDDDVGPLTMGDHLAPLNKISHEHVSVCVAVLSYLPFDIVVCPMTGDGVPRKGRLAFAPMTAKAELDRHGRLTGGYEAGALGIIPGVSRRGRERYHFNIGRFMFLPDYTEFGYLKEDYEKNPRYPHTYTHGGIFVEDKKKPNWYEPHWTHLCGALSFQAVNEEIGQEIGVAWNHSPNLVGLIAPTPATGLPLIFTKPQVAVTANLKDYDGLSGFFKRFIHPDEVPPDPDSGRYGSANHVVAHESTSKKNWGDTPYKIRARAVINGRTDFNPENPDSSTGTPNPHSKTVLLILDEI